MILSVPLNERPIHFFYVGDIWKSYLKYLFPSQLLTKSCILLSMCDSPWWPLRCLIKSKTNELTNLKNTNWYPHVLVPATASCEDWGGQLSPMSTAPWGMRLVRSANQVVEQIESYFCTIFQEMLSFLCQLQRPRINLPCSAVTNKST